jgi:hypothetical protein
MAITALPPIVFAHEIATREVRQLSDVQSVNLQLLHTIRLGLERDPVGTCRKFCLQQAQAEALRALPPEHLLDLVCALGQTSLFVARNDLVDLLAAPIDFVGILAAARPAVPSSGLAQ